MEDPPELQCLAAWLKERFPRDVLIPCLKGAKRPLHAYGADSPPWGWSAYDGVANKASYDWAIVLCDLCCVDVDDAEAGEELLARFKELAEAPCERTRRGIHYFFKRHNAATLLGYFDGAAQLRHGIDFKSVSRNGTGGIIVVAPSTDKSWLRAPWDTPPQVMPLALLASVAKPEPVAPLEPPPIATLPPARPLSPTPATSTPALESLALTFPDDAGAPSLTIGGEQLKLLRRSEMVRTLFSGRWSVAGSKATPTMSVPGSRKGMVDLLSVLTAGCHPGDAPPTVRRLAAQDAVADSLLLPAELLALARVPSTHGRLTFETDLYTLSPRWWQLSRDEEVRLTAGPAASNAALLRVDRTLARSLRYIPLPKARSPGAWLFAELPPLLTPKQAGVTLLVEDPAASVSASLPAPLRAILQRHRSCAVLAGGAVLGAAARFIPAGADFDVFLFGLDEAGSQAVLADVTASLRGTHTVTSSVAAVTFTPKRAEPTAPITAADLPIQLILGMHDTRGEILEHFDLAPVKIMAYVTGEGAAPSAPLVLEALPSWVASMENLACWVDPAVWSESSPARIMKYIAKGFELSVPGVRRAAFAPLQPAAAKPPATATPGSAAWWATYRSSRDIMTESRSSLHSEGMRGMRVLFAAEAEVLASRHFKGECEWVTPIDGRLRSVEADTIASKVRGMLGTQRAPPSGGGGYGFVSRRNRGSDGGGPRGPRGFSKTYGFIRDPFRRDVAVELADERRGRTHVADAPDWMAPPHWLPTGRFTTAPPLLDLLHDAAALERCAQEEAAARRIEVLGAEDEPEPRAASQRTPPKPARIVAAAPATPQPCATCKSLGAPMRCANCQVAYYCNSRCQKAHWPAHKAVCTAPGS